MTYSITNSLVTKKTNTASFNASIATVAKDQSIIANMQTLQAKHPTDITIGNTMSLAKFINVFAKDFDSVKALRKAKINSKNCDKAKNSVQIVKAYVEVAKHLEHIGMTVSSKDYYSKMEIKDSSYTSKRLRGKANATTSATSGRIKHDLARLSTIVN